MGTRAWRGDKPRWGRYFEPAGVSSFLQGDAAVRYPDASYTFHGRTDEVINVGGNRIGTAEIENALLEEGARGGSLRIEGCAVVGVVDELVGTVPCAFVALGRGGSLAAPMVAREQRAPQPGVTRHEAGVKRSVHSMIEEN